MDDTLERALAKIARKTEGANFDGAVRLEFVEVGAIRIDSAGARMDDGSETDCVISADLETFRLIFDGELSPTAAFMTGRLRIAGDMGAALRAASLIA